MELKCIKNESMNCWHKIIGTDYVESQACSLNIECPWQFVIPISE
jgi:hypothetical protein